MFKPRGKVREKKKDKEEEEM